MPKDLLICSLSYGTSARCCSQMYETRANHCKPHLKCINIAKSVLNVAVDNQFRQAKNFSAQMEGISKPRFLSFLFRAKATQT